MNKLQKNGKKIRKEDVGGIFAIFCVICIITLGVWAVVDSCNKDKNYMENFYQRENSTLVEIDYDNGCIFFSSATGYIDNSILENWKKDEETKGTITVYNPYTKGKSVIVRTESVYTIEEITYRECYEQFDPETYK